MSGGAEIVSVNSTSNNTHTIGSLTPGTLYTVKVIGLKNGSESDSLQGDQGTKPEVPTNMQLSAVDTDVLQVAWDASSSVDAYRVTYQSFGGPETDYVSSTSNTTLNIRGLLALTRYTVKVYGITNGVESLPLQGMERTRTNIFIPTVVEAITTRNDPDIFGQEKRDLEPKIRKNPDGLPEAPTNLHFITVGTGTLEATWTGSADDYTVTAESAGNLSSALTSNTTHIFRSLSPGTLYTVRVTGIQNGSQSLPLDGQQGTSKYIS
ncbi:fibronectin-like [Branchiostoma lanceolatum]|uniref:fibronectin-like n=1 Tax=Branchiostoma lanceolatum TaxID=7740 RepID=UPI0034557C1C